METAEVWSAVGVAMGGLLFVWGGLRFRRWAVEDRAGIPRFPIHLETVMLWMLYSASIAVGIIVLKQALRHL